MNNEGVVKGLFITGTDTGVGKTYVAAMLLRQWAADGWTTTAMKPVASGCEDRGRGLRNDDACCLRRHASLRLPYEQVNPYAFAPPVAPHLAAARAGVRIDRRRILDGFRRLQGGAERLVVEGVGGWRVPLGDDFNSADLARDFGLPVLMVVGLRLGCINHALLTAAAIAADGCRLAGWVANAMDPQMDWPQDNVAALTERLPAPCVGQLPWGGETRLAV